MVSLESLRRRAGRVRSHPALLVRELNRLYHRRLYRHDYNRAGVDVMAEDWDTLVVLDACRYDLFEQRHDLPGTLERRRSRGSHTVEFLVGNFHDRELLDTVYVTASPQLERWRDRIDVTFHDEIDVWQGDGWNDDHETVLPETVTDRALAAAERYPNKRLVVHFFQPHYPFIDADPELNPRGVLADGHDIWGLLSRGDLSIPAEKILDAYRRNLDRALPSVRRLLDEREGRTVVTADHGNLLGERSSPIPVRDWGHPPGIHTPELVDVPWLVFQHGQRPDIVAEQPTDDRVDVADSGVEDRLAALGYAE